MAYRSPVARVHSVHDHRFYARVAATLFARSSLTRAAKSVAAAEQPQQAPWGQRQVGDDGERVILAGPVAVGRNLRTPQGREAFPGRTRATNHESA
jgi:hypothetical protein